MSSLLYIIVYFSSFNTRLTLDIINKNFFLKNSRKLNTSNKYTNTCWTSEKKKKWCRHRHPLINHWRTTIYRLWSLTYRDDEKKNHRISVLATKVWRLLFFYQQNFHSTIDAFYLTLKFKFIRLSDTSISKLSKSYCFYEINSNFG